jgi:dihydrofolate reductase
MPKVRVAGFGVSLDGFSAGTEQSIDNPLGKRGPEIFQWFFHTKTFHAMRTQYGGSTDIDDEFAFRSMDNFGAFILGRNMFGPVRGPWRDDSWKGWWGDNPPYHAPTFVLTHHAREPLVMYGGTTFHFITAGIQAARSSVRKKQQVRRTSRLVAEFTPCGNTCGADWSTLCTWRLHLSYSGKANRSSRV